MRVYCDSVIPIYYLEGTPPFKAHAVTRLAALWAAGDLMVISDLVRLECRVQPIRLGDAVRLAEYDNLFSQSNVEVVPITTAIIDRATVIRAVYDFKLGDSIAPGRCRGVPLRSFSDPRSPPVGLHRYSRGSATLNGK